jgi:Txe/YoeB family toxin of Txe-Axe toxin-antitoxin module
MKIKGIRISDKKNNIVSVELPDILLEISNGNSLYWSVLYLYATGSLGENKSMLALEEQIKNSERGLCISWDELNNLAKKFWDLIDITIIGCNDKSLIKRYNDDQKMRETCNTVIEMIDSGCWEVFSKDEKLIERLSQKYKNIEFI